MRTIRQLGRQPLKTLLGIVLIALAVSILCLCVSQALAASNTLAELDYNFTTIALLTGDRQEDLIGNTRFISTELPEDLSNWIDKVIGEHPDIVTSADPGLASAVIPELTPDNITQHIRIVDGMNDFDYFLESKPVGTPYSCAMLEIILDEIGEPSESIKTYRLNSAGDIGELSNGIYVPLTGTVYRVIGLQEGYADPTGFTLKMTLRLPDMDAWNEMELLTGEHYLVYGMDYYDQDWYLRGMISDGLMRDLIGPLDPDGLHYLTDEERLKYIKNGAKNPPIAYYDDGSIKTSLDSTEVGFFRSATLTLEDKSIMPQYDWNIGENGYPSPSLRTEYSYLDENGVNVTISEEAYRERYTVPTIVHLDRSAEEFLSAEDGTRWLEALDNLRLNNHSFPVIGVDKLGHVAEFTLGNARIVGGRDFTQEEMDSGAKVCVIAESLAAASGLSVGDVITPQFYNYDWSSPYQYFLDGGEGSIDPSSYYITPTVTFEETADTYTIIGLYRQDNEWAYGDDNLYSFTPNTIFVPRASVPSTMDHGDQGFFQTLVIENGKIEEFQRLAADAGYDDVLFYYDQGYTTVAKSLFDYQDVASQAMLTGLLIYIALLSIFLVMFPLQQKKNLLIMNSLGAPKTDMTRHTMLYSIGILVPGTVIGIGAGAILWKHVVDALMNSAKVMVAIELHFLNIALPAIIQLLVALLLTLQFAHVITKKILLSKRR